MKALDPQQTELLVAVVSTSVWSIAAVVALARLVFDCYFR